MPATEVVIYSEMNGRCPLLEWMDSIPRKAQDKCLVRIERLKEMGHELRRPEADTLRDDIRELRASFMGVHYRILYFFHGQKAVLSHGLTKESIVPDKDIDLALRRKWMFAADPDGHTHIEEETHA